jgi:hypothetical protein
VTFYLNQCRKFRQEMPSHTYTRNAILASRSEDMTVTIHHLSPTPTMAIFKA